MLKHRKTVCAIFGIVALLVMMAGCGSTPIAEENPTDLKFSEINFENEPNGNLTINNLADFDTVVFAGKVENGRMLGGIEAGQTRSFDFSRISDIPLQGALLIRVVSYDTYSSKVLITEEDVLWTGLVVYDLNDGDAKQEINIYEGIDETQKSFVYVSNASKFILDLRLGSPTGERIATIAPEVRNKRLELDPPADGMPLDLWPTYIHIDSKNNITSFTPSDEADSRWVLPSTGTENLPVTEFRGPVESIAFKVAFVRLFNGTKYGMMFYSNQAVLTDQSGSKLVNPDDSSIFEIPSTNGTAGQTYNDLKFRIPGFDMLIEEYTFMPGIEYEIHVTDKYGILEYTINEIGAYSIPDTSQMLVFE